MTVDRTSGKRFQDALDEASMDPDKPQAKCVVWVRENPGKPNPWVDWATDLSDAEPQEVEIPSLERAKMLCEGCPLEDLCTAANLAKPKYHGVYGTGVRYENGRRVR